MIKNLEPGVYSRLFLSSFPHRGSTFSEQLQSCLQVLEENARTEGLDLSNVLMLTFFMRAEDNKEYYRDKTIGTSILPKFFDQNIPATSFVAQHPEDGKQVSLDAILLSQADEEKIHHKHCDGILYTAVESPQATEIYVAGLTNHTDRTDKTMQSRDAFESLKKVLQSEGMDFSHIVRQWNYIEKFLDTSSGTDGIRQNYQIFNDVRSAYYGEAAFTAGYPASTGIGMFSGGVILECIAIKATSDIHITPLSNPLQEDAHAYSQDVLVGDSCRGFEKKSPPLFERAKILVKGQTGTIFVSGTAAVRGEETVQEQDIQSQTTATIENIDALISAKNLLSNGVNIGPNSPRLSQLRAYVKREADLPSVKTICQDHFGSIPAQYVLSDICREALLVEIEGTVSVPIKGIQDRRGGSNV